jgi:cell division protein ZapA
VAQTELIIAGRRYVLNCAPGQEARLQELGRRFDARVNELSRVLGELGPERLFLAAGLSILDDADADPLSGEALLMDERIRDLETLAASRLSDAAAAIEALAERFPRTRQR